MLVGKCLCGTVRYAVEGPFLYAGYCHCSRCRAASGSAFSAFAGIGQDRLRVTAGNDSIALFDNSVSLCRPCGTSLFSLVRDGQYFHVAMGTLEDDPGIRPMFHIFVGSKGPGTRSRMRFRNTPSFRLRRRVDAPAIAPAARRGQKRRNR